MKIKTVKIKDLVLRDGDAFPIGEAINIEQKNSFVNIDNKVYNFLDMLHSGKELPPIIMREDSPNVLFDGMHRVLAYILDGREELEIVEVNSSIYEEIK